MTFVVGRTFLDVHDPSTDEATLWAGALRGDGRDFAALFRLHRERVLRAARRSLASATDAEDVASAAFFELWRHRGRVVVVDGSVLPWLLVTTQNLARNLNRGLGRYRALLDSLPRERAEEDPADLLAARQRLTDLGRACRHLAPTDAALVALVGFDGLTVSAAAAVLGLSSGAARTRLSRSRRRLRTLLGDSGGGIPTPQLHEGSPE